MENMSFRLLDIIVTKRETIDPQPVAAEVLFEYLKDMFSGNKEQKIRFAFSGGTVYAEANLLKSVLLNLVDNACKASSPGGLVEVLGKRLEDAYAFQVKDFGVGIPEEELMKVTEAFYMVDKSRSRSRNGAGLGLALCVEILRLHDSELEIESKVGEGTCISFVIPDRKETPEQDAQTAQKDAEETLLQNEIAHKALRGTESQPGRRQEAREEDSRGRDDAGQNSAGEADSARDDSVPDDAVRGGVKEGGRGQDGTQDETQERAEEDAEREDDEEELGEA